MFDEFVKKLFFTTEHPEITEKIFFYYRALANIISTFPPVVYMKDSSSLVVPVHAWLFPGPPEMGIVVIPSPSRGGSGWGWGSG
jgi:hypothetical protein